MTKEDEETKRSNRAVCAAACFCFLAILAMIAVVAMAIYINADDDDDKPVPVMNECSEPEPLQACGTSPQGVQARTIDLSEPTDPDVFHDLTSEEMKRVRAYLEQTINLSKPHNARLADAHLYTMELQLPSKASVLEHLDNGGPAPDRVARVVVFRGDLQPPVVQELLCGPLSDITNCTTDLEEPFSHRPMEKREYSIYERTILQEIHQSIGDIIRESYDASFDVATCGEKCLVTWFSPVSNNVYDLADVRTIWLVGMYSIPYFSLFPIDFAVLANVTGVDESRFAVEKVWYNGQLFESIDDFKTRYQNGSIEKTVLTFPVPEENQYSKINPRSDADAKPNTKQRPPELVEPDGKRYSITNRKIDYLDMWSFHYRISSIHGPALYDVRFQGDRIAYEISLMELLAIYSADNPAARVTTYPDTAYQLGGRTKSMISGGDCPTTATMLPNVVPSQGQEEPVTFQQAACVFEQNTGQPLRRHHAYSTGEGRFYGGLLDSALVIRTIHAVDNYDYVVEFKFHQNGALGVSVFSSGYMMTSYYTDAEAPYGFRLTPLATAPLHMHTSHFKVDLDISGTSNRYETLNLEEVEVDLRQFSPPRKYSSTRMVPSLKRTEEEAVYMYNFDTPKYHVFHNDAERNIRGEKKAYRLLNKSMTKQLAQTDVGSEPAHTWTRHQLAVTKHRDSERVSNTFYGQWGTKNPTVRFQDWIDDNEAIVDEDLVAWVTMAMYHIPHTEDLPVVSTPGNAETFYLLPYNYFPECPSMKSRDSVYIQHMDQSAPEKGLRYEFPEGKWLEGTAGKCEYKPFNITRPWSSDPDLLFETTKNNGVL